ncbi:Chromosome condensation protein dpy-27 [Caenorhabditis elegans]|uniref:Chromosome condensation protein dpy-27 n=1 Tax=Caenorhabditis elegans TaxID=6239 RepID=DPY27_CAEEL|nr:Chromosome condensation protein dpy-27 [Caenorhabditis elegans]P48996.1 RecName: Full=Chromosome condensation protein dpy-27; AltName: Full=Protein dumpy-27 [Caenorhabditis elegans]AAA62647.1 chromosome condensation protein [Caenorhabditis elegans]CAA84669.1 Chromosome condensation protein dpy-27 [Caenorhabditis elegans]|eukprot:NP_497771.1 Chromosome condensation protein dpy-27 [Caenorhabditis elegans]
MQPFKRRALTSDDDRPYADTDSMPEVDLDVDRRRQYMEQLNIFDDVSSGAYMLELEAAENGVKYDEKEDLLNVQIPPKYEDQISDPDGNRMIILNIYVENFKSYAGKHILGPFHKNLTMILGPNGSGKSNVIDALLFVFGFKAGKIRTKKLSALINSGGNYESCSVTIMFQMVKDMPVENYDKYEVLTDNCVCITRTINRENNSKYRIDDKDASQKDVQELLLRAGIDMTHNRFLILQGEVEAIALMKPTSKNPNEEGMLEYIEDIVGTNRFVAPISKLMHRVSLLEHKSSQYGASVRRHEGHLKVFEKAMVIGMAYLNTFNNLNYLRGIRVKHNLCRYAETMRDAKMSLVTRTGELEENKDIMLEAKDEVRKKETHERSLNSIVTELENKRIDWQSKKNDWHARDAKRKQGLKSCTQDLGKLMKERDEARREKFEIETAPENARISKQNMQLEWDQLKEQENVCQRTATENLIKYDQKSSADRAKHDDLEKKLSDELLQSMRAKAELDVSESELKDMTIMMEQGQKRVDELKGTLQTMMAENIRDNTELNAVTTELQDRKLKFDKAVEKLPHLKSTEQLLRSKKYELDQEVIEASNTQEVTYRHQATAKLHELKEAGLFPGFKGRLGDLASIPIKFDTAISTVFFAQLDYHVVQTSDECRIGIGFCHEYKLPRTTFVFLDHLKDTDTSGMDSTMKFPAERLFDKIHCVNPEIRREFYFLIHDILVVDSLEEATRIDKKYPGRHRYCTLNGSILNRSGALTGGGKPTTGRIRNDNNPNMSGVKKVDLSKLRAAQEKHNHALEAHLKLQLKQEEIRADNGPIIKQLEIRKRELIMSTKEQKTRIAELKSSIAAHERRMVNYREVTVEDLDEKRAQIADLKRQVEESQKSSAKIKQQIEQYKRKMDRMFMELVQKNKDSIEQAKDRMGQLEQDIARQTAIIENNPSHLEQAEKKLSELEHMCLEKRSEADALAQLEVGEDVKGIDIINAQLQTSTASIDAQRARYTEAVAARREADAAYQTTVDNYNMVKQTYDELMRIIDDLENKTMADNAELDIIESAWMQPEKLYPPGKFVRYNDPDIAAKMTDGHVVLPYECISMIEPHREAYEEHEARMLEDDVFEDTANKICKLEKDVDKFRREFDNKGVRDYAMIVSLLMNEVTSAKKFSDKLKAHREKLNELRMARFNEFSEALAFLGTTTQMLYQLITNGGDASLKFVEEGKSTDPFDGGIKFSVRPAKKSWKLIENLSGGEKTLASLCFVFAMHHYRPTPLYVMDEIDAALDLNNVSLIANYIKHSERTRNAQFIIISLRNQMFEVGNRLLGIYKIDGKTYNIMVDPIAVEIKNRPILKIFEEEIKRREKLRRAEIEPEIDLSNGLSNVVIAPKRKQRRLEMLKLSDFGLDDDSDLPEFNRFPPATRRELSVEDSDEDDEPVRRRPRRQVEEEDEEDELIEEATPSPPPIVVQRRVRRSRH